MKKSFHLDNSNAVLLGVCSGIAEYTGINATIVRIGAVILTIMGGFPWTFVAYGAVAWLAKPGGYRGRNEQGRPPRVSRDEIRARVADADRRMAEVETYVAGSNSNLAREIDSLR